MDGKNAEKLEAISESMWKQCNPFNTNIVKEFLENKTDLSVKTKNVYLSGLRIFFYWVYVYLGNKSCLDIKKKDFIKYLNWLTNRGLSESSIRLKKSCVSALCNYIMVMYEEEYPTFRSFVTQEMKIVKTGNVYEKQPLTPDEYLHLCEELEQLNEWQKLAYLIFSYSTGCRRAEARQLRKEVINYEPSQKIITVIDEDGKECTVVSKSYQTHMIRCKGSSVVGKPRKLKFGEDAMQSLKKWISVRGNDKCPFMFVTITKDGQVKQVAESTFNEWCSGLFAKIVGRRVHPHLLRESRATNLVVYEHKSAEVAQKLLGHNDVSTTKNHYIINNNVNDESDEAFI